jgi:16S rRNA processing protein RimM
MMTGLEAAELPTDAIEVGKILDAWGIKGWFKIQSYSAQPEALFSSRRWFLLPATSGLSGFQGAVKLSIIEAKEHSDYVVANARDVMDRNAAQSLRGARIFVPRSSFPTAGHDEYYWVDLIGLQVVNRQGLLLGEVKELLSAGPQTVLVLELLLDNQPVERMIPFVAAFVDTVDLEGRKIQVDWQPDY